MMRPWRHTNKINVSCQNATYTSTNSRNMHHGRPSWLLVWCAFRNRCHIAPCIHPLRGPCLWHGSSTHKTFFPTSCLQLNNSLRCRALVVLSFTCASRVSSTSWMMEAVSSSTLKRDRRMWSISGDKNFLSWATFWQSTLNQHQVGFMLTNISDSVRTRPVGDVSGGWVSLIQTVNQPINPRIRRLCSASTRTRPVASAHVNALSENWMRTL